MIALVDIEPCDQLETEDLGASALFDLTRVGLLPLSKMASSCFDSLSDGQRQPLSSVWQIPSLQYKELLE